MALDSFGLTLMQRLFCEHYLSNGFKGTQAAIEAGYSKRSAAEIASENLNKPQIKKFVEKRVKEIAEKIGLNTEYMLTKLKQGIDFSIPSEEKVKNIFDVEEFTLKDKTVLMQSIIDVRAGVSCISEANKMLGNYAPDKHALLVEEDKTGKVTDLMKQYEKDF